MGNTARTKVTGNGEVRGAGHLTQGVTGASQPEWHCGQREDSGRCAVWLHQGSWPSVPEAPCISLLDETWAAQMDDNVDGKLAGPSDWKGQLLVSGRKHNWWSVSLTDASPTQYCLMFLFTAWTVGWSTLSGNYTFQLFWEFFLELIEGVSLLKTHKSRNYMIGLLLYTYIL